MHLGPSSLACGGTWRDPPLLLNFGRFAPSSHNRSLFACALALQVRAPLGRVCRGVERQPACGR
eukprot:3329798-Pyramimonas_sp.AAC.1